MTRKPELDALRGLMLLLITVTHVPTTIADRLSQPFGFVSAAEGFVFLSAFLVGGVYTKIAFDKGPSAMRRGMWGRAAVVWAWHVAMLLYLFTIIAALGMATDQAAIKNMISFYMQAPVTALLTSFALIYNPPLLDILPMYVLFMLASPLALTLGLRWRRYGWTIVFGVSLLLWVFAQFELDRGFYAWITSKSVVVPLHQTGAFELAAWQFLWIFGLWMGSSMQAGENVDHDEIEKTKFQSTRILLLLALAIVIGCMIWRHVVGQAPFGARADLNLLFDKWQLGPFRLINFFAMMIVVMHFGPRVTRVRRFRFLEVLGNASLPVFCAHLVCALLMLALVGDKRGQMPLQHEVMILLGTVAVLYVVAFVAAKVPASKAALPKKPGPDDRRPELVPGLVKVQSIRTE
ncbi:MAG TPA: OpgC domain-containing protein [Burkholderiaceae bacterium]|nr:OpgC domain-containing protein [Burkholderiaceae bacterium]